LARGSKLRAFFIKALIMKCLELFAGKNTFSQLARAQGFETLTTDWKKMKGIDVVCDIKDFRLIETNFRPDIIWASPECKTFSIAASGTHFKKIGDRYETLTEKGGDSLIMVDEMIRVIKEAISLNPCVIYYIENPVGLISVVSKLTSGLFSPFPLREVRIDQCSYGRDCKKPTIIFTNSQTLKGLRCVGKDCHHARRDMSQTSYRYHGMVAPSMKKGYYASAQIPELLSLAILKDFKNGQKKHSI
jgi:hypothetical protein